jgi:hypothetical protein
MRWQSTNMNRIPPWATNNNNRKQGFVDIFQEQVFQFLMPLNILIGLTPVFICICKVCYASCCEDQVIWHGVGGENASTSPFPLDILYPIVENTSQVALS